MRAKMTVRVRSTVPDAALTIEVLDSAGQVAGSGSGSGGPKGVAVELPLVVDLLLDDAEKPMRVTGRGELLRDAIEVLTDEVIAAPTNDAGTYAKMLAAECVRAVQIVRGIRQIETRHVNENDSESDPSAEVGVRLAHAQNALAQRLARIEHLEARHAERAARVPGEPRAGV